MNYHQRETGDMNYALGAERLDALRRQIAETRREMRRIQAAMEPQPVKDYVLGGKDGDARLSELFAGKDDLIVIHNMGTTCASCTLWADGFNGVYAHLADRASFVVSSPDSPQVQQEFAASRGWRFPMVSHRGTTFAADMGYLNEKGRPMPGVSVFRRKDGKIVRVSDAAFDSGDDFCAVWRLLDLLPEGPAGWRPKFRYD